MFGRMEPVRGALLGAVLAVVMVLSPGCGERTGPEVWVIGLDCADWDLLGPMMDRGELPNLAALRRGGAAGVLLSDEPMLSPVLWNSIATGKTPDQHGITWFMTDAPEGGKVPVGSGDRRVRALWNIADEAGLRSGVVGWWASWPAEPLAGFVVTDYVGWHSFGVTGRESAPGGRTWPADLAGRVDELMPSPAAIPDELLARMVHLPPAELAYDPARAAAVDDPLTLLRQAVATSRGYVDIVLDRLDHERPELLALYFEGTDVVGHLFGKYAPPRLDWIDPAEFAVYRDAVTEYWKWQDSLLGELLARRGPQTTVLVCSDHGFRVGLERRREEILSIENADADHMPDGVIIVNGPQTPVGRRLQGADIYDVAPTVLHALGLPVAMDMAGEVLAEAFLPASRLERPVTAVATYETGPLARADRPRNDPEQAAGLERKLRSLGYLNSAQGGGSQAASEQEQTLEQTVNLATVLMRQGRADEAVERLREELTRNPGVVEVRLNLAQALARSGRGAEADRLYRELLAEAPERLDVVEDLATYLELADRPAEALAVFEQGLAHDPQWVDGLVGKGRALMHLDRGPEAERALRTALGLDPTHHRGNLFLGTVLADRQDWDGALAALRRAHQVEPGDAATAVRLSSVLERRGDAAGALQVLGRTRDMGGSSLELLGNLGALLLRTGRSQEAVAALEAARELDGEVVAVLGNLGVAYAMNGRMPEAIAAFEQVVRLEPGSAESHDQLGSFYARVGRLAQAETQLEKAADLDPRNPGTRLRLGMTYFGAGQLQQARQAFREAIRLGPGLALAYYKLGVLEGILGNVREQARLLDKARQLDPKLSRGSGGGAGWGAPR